MEKFVETVKAQLIDWEKRKEYYQSRLREYYREHLVELPPFGSVLRKDEKDFVIIGWQKRARRYPILVYSENFKDNFFRKCTLPWLEAAFILWVPPESGFVIPASRKDKVYRGRRIESGCSVWSNGVLLPDFTEVINHSPTGFEWGYNGSGPAQLALAMLCDYYGDYEKAKTNYQDFKSKVISKIKEDEWKITVKDIVKAGFVR